MTLSSQELRALIHGGAELALIDVREKRASDAAHILGASNVPRRLLEERMATLVPRRETTVCVYDDDLTVAPRAVDDLRAVGYTGAVALDGGLTAWRQAGYPVSRGHSVPSKHFGELIQQHDAVPTVTAEELHRWLDEGRRVVLCDVRTPEEHARETLPGSVNVPGFELPHRLDALVDDPEAMVVVHCSGRTRSIIGAATLQRSGLERVVALENGTMGWLLAGHEVEHGAARDATVQPATPDAERAARWRHHAESVGATFVSAEEAHDVHAVVGADRTVQLFDVRTAAEHRAGHPAGAVWAPGGQLVQLTDTFVAVRSATLVLTCDGSVRAAVAAYWLRRMGFGPVLVIDGGVSAWRDAGLPMTEGVDEVVLGRDVAARAVPAITAAALQPALAERTRPIVVSVDPSERYATGHLPDARWVSPTWLEARLEQIGAHRDQPVVFTCADGQRAPLAAWKARRAGWCDVIALSGGLRAWQEQGGPVEQGAPHDVADPDDVFTHPIYRGADAMRDYLDWEIALGERYAEVAG